jgi:chloramphenicol O-acetyltransferase type A
VEYIDLETWDRRSYFERYLGTDFPYIVITAHVDVTNLLAFTLKHGLSSYLSMVFAAHHAADSIVNFHYRTKEDRPVFFDTMYPCFTYMPEGSELFILVTMDYVEDILMFNEKAKAHIAAQGSDPGWDDAVAKGGATIGYSGVPWIQYTHVTRTIMKFGVDSAPKITWGKYFSQGDRTLAALSVQTHHGLMDGIHVGWFYERMQQCIDSLPV